jgi:hypothetical protein
LKGEADGGADFSINSIEASLASSQVKIVPANIVNLMHVAITFVTFSQVSQCCGKGCRALRHRSARGTISVITWLQ